jgi:hypothetical protein
VRGEVATGRGVDSGQRGAIAVVPGGLGFTILNVNATVVAQYAASGGEMSMSSGWTYAMGSSSSTPLLVTDTIVIDIGATDPSGSQLQFVAVGTGYYDGTTSPVTLP